MTNDAFTIEGKNVIVTGGAMGIGFGIAKRFAVGGANVLIADLDEKAARRAADAIKPPCGKVAVLGVDVGEDGAGAAMVNRAIEAFGGVDVLVNNAGIFPMVPLLKMTSDLFDRVMRVNLRGLALASKAAAQHMVTQGRGGAIVNIGSVDSVHPSMVGLAAYDSSKGAVLMFTRSLALELAPHRIRVNSVLPGGVETEGTQKPMEGSGMTEVQLKAFKDDFVKRRVPMGRMGSPDDIATAVQFLVSPAAAYITGASLVVDGGMLLT